MRYRKGMIALSEARDYPLLRRVLHSSFVTPGQLYQFMKLDYCASSRNAFDNGTGWLSFRSPQSSTLRTMPFLK